jgi:hypothetical protein
MNGKKIVIVAMAGALISSLARLIVQKCIAVFASRCRMVFMTAAGSRSA